MNHPFDEHIWSQVSTHLLDSYKRRIEKASLDICVEVFRIAKPD